MPGIINVCLGMSELNREDKTVPVYYQSTEEKVIDICNKAFQTIENKELYTITFDSYNNLDSIMRNADVFPYIIKNNHIEWMVPYSEVSIKDFYNMNGCENGAIIKVNIRNHCGAGFGVSILDNILSWVQHSIPYLDAINNIAGCVQLGVIIVRTIKKCFCKKKVNRDVSDQSNLIPVPYEVVKEAITKKMSWNLDQLMQFLGIEQNDQNVKVIIMLLDDFGYEKQGDVYCYKNQNIARDHIIMSNNDSQIKHLCKEINDKMFVLRIYSEITGLDYYQYARYNVDHFVQSYDELFEYVDEHSIIRCSAEAERNLDKALKNSCIEDSQIEKGQAYYDNGPGRYLSIFHEINVLRQLIESLCNYLLYVQGFDIDQDEICLTGNYLQC